MGSIRIVRGETLPLVLKATGAGAEAWQPVIQMRRGRGGAQWASATVTWRGDGTGWDVIVFTSALPAGNYLLGGFVSKDGVNIATTELSVVVSEPLAALA